MNPTQLLSHFDRISEAPNAIPRLRRFILDLAVRGKLVEQDPMDDAASELLNRIEQDVRERKATGEYSDPRSFIEIPLDSLPFVVPPSWRWARLIEIADVSYGFAFESSRFTSTKTGKPLIRIRDISSTDTEAYYDGDFDEAYLVHNGDYLVGMDGDFNLRKWTGPDALLNQRVMRINKWRVSLVAEFLAIPFQMILDHLHGSTSQTTVKHLSAKQTNGIYLPIPPLAEQHRIVDKVNELMALCDRLEVAQSERESQRDQLAAASLHRLNNGADADDFRNHARFYFNHLPRLTARSEHIQQLRKAILNLAVRGQLVHQDPSDEPASELLIRIQAEKARLLKEGKIGPEKPPFPARVDELAFELKPGWQAARISQILVELQTGPFGSSLHQSDYQKGGIPVINPASIKNERLVPVESMAVGPKTLERLATFKLRAGDIVMARRGEMGRCAFVTKQENGWLCGTGSLILRLPEFVFPNFFVTLIGSPFVREYLGSSAVGATMQNLNQSILLNLVIGLPPLAEQHRIVAKVEELMALCDRLEAQLTTTQTESRRLLDAVLHDALSIQSEILPAGVA